MDVTLNLKEYQTFGKFNMVGVGWVQHTKVEIYELKNLMNFLDEDFSKASIKPVKILNNEDADAIAFANVRLDCGEIGNYEKFMVGVPTYSHWRLYKKALEDYNEILIANSKKPEKH